MNSPATRRAALNVFSYRLGHLHFRSADSLSMVCIINGWLDNKKATSSSAVRARAISYINPHVYNISHKQTTVSQFINQCSLVCVDGIGTAWALRRRTSHAVNRVVALHLFDALIHELAMPCSAVLIGVSDDEVQRCACNINAMNSHFRIIATMNGFSEKTDYDRFLNKHKNIQWVLIGAGSPKSEHIALQALAVCSQAIVFHMGAGTIKVYAGTKRRAPVWVSRMGFEWLHRVVFEPHTRERYTKGSVQFLKRVYEIKK